jgi:very-short-patch-repair endonuclease
MDLKPRTVRARELRRDQTDAERRLWRMISNRQLGGYKFRRQVPIDRYFADFACVEARLIVELDGGQHSEQELYDAERTKVLEACGWRVIRFWNHQLSEDDSVRDMILAELKLPQNRWIRVHASSSTALAVA